MKSKKLLDRILEGRKVEYDLETVRSELLADLALVESIRKDKRISDEDVVAAETEIRIKWKDLEPEILSYWAATRRSDQIKSKVVLHNKLKQLHFNEIERKRPPAIIQEPTPVKTLREKIEERRAASETKQKAREVPTQLKGQDKIKDKKKPK